MSLTSPHDILSAYSKGFISSGDAISKLHFDGYRDLVITLANAGHDLPRSSDEEILSQVRAALPLHANALREEQ